MKGRRYGHRLVPVSERTRVVRCGVASVAVAAGVSRPGPRLAVTAVPLIPAVVRALRGGGEQGHQVAVGLVGDARHVGWREGERFCGRPARIDGHRAVGRLDGFFPALLRLALRRLLSRGGVHHEHPGGFRGGCVEDEDQLRIGRRDGPRLARGSARQGWTRHELLPEFGKPVHRRLRRFRDRIGLRPWLARRHPRGKGSRKELRPAAGADHVCLVVRIVNAALELDQGIAFEPRSVPAGILVDDNGRRPHVLARAAIQKVRARAADDNLIFVPREADDIHVGPQHRADNLCPGPLGAGHACRADVLVAAIADVRRNVARERRSETRRSAGHSPHSIAPPRSPGGLPGQ